MESQAAPPMTVNSVIFLCVAVAYSEIGDHDRHEYKCLCEEEDNVTRNLGLRIIVDDFNVWRSSNSSAL